MQVTRQVTQTEEVSGTTLSRDFFFFFLFLSHSFLFIFFLAFTPGVGSKSEE